MNLKDTLKNDKNSIINCLLLVSWVFFGILIVLYIFIGCKNILNADSALVTDYSQEQIRTGNIFPDGLYETNDFWIYSLIPIITPLLKLGMGLLAARQTAVLIQSAVLFILLFKLFYEKTDKYVLLIPGLIIASGISGQILFEVFGDATYGSIIVYMLLTLYFATEYLTKNKKYCLVIIIISLILLTMCSLRFPIYITAPLIVVIGYLYYKNGIKKEYTIFAIALIVSTVAGILLNKFLQYHLIYIYNFRRTIITEEPGLSANFFNTLYQYLFISGATNINVVSLNCKQSMNLYSNSLAVGFVFVRYIYAIFTIMLPFILKRKFNFFTLKEKIIYIYIITMSFLIVFFDIIGGMAEWYRYLIPVVFFLSLLYILFYKYFIKERKQKVLFILLLVIFCAYSVIMNLTSYRFSKSIKELTDFLLEKDLKFGYVYINSVQDNIYNLQSNGQIRVLTINRETQYYYWLKSGDWYEDDYYNGKAFFIRYEIDTPLECEDQADEKIEFDWMNSKIYIFIFKDVNILRNCFIK